MISIVCVFNDAEMLESRLLRSLASQTARHEIITVDNRSSRFENAATALNWGARRAQGEWIIFAHQDVVFLSDDWLSRAENLLNQHASSGWYGVAGLSSSGLLQGILRDRAILWGAPFEEPAEVQTLDECLLIHRRETEEHQYFDENVPGWHAYGVDACCAAIRAGASNYVLPLPLWHDSRSTNLRGLKESHAYVWRKHGPALKRIYTTCGVLPTVYGWNGSSWNKVFNRLWPQLCAAGYLMTGYPRAFRRGYLNLLESFTEKEDVTECLHTRAWFERIEAAAFVPHPKRSRRIIHRFLDWNAENLQSDCVVVAADLARNLNGNIECLHQLRQRVRRLLLCIDLDDARAKPALWKELMSHSSTARLGLQVDGTWTAVLELSS